MIQGGEDSRVRENKFTAKIQFFLMQFIIGCISNYFLLDTRTLDHSNP